jgi:hypothetical protein
VVTEKCSSYGERNIIELRKVSIESDFKSVKSLKASMMVFCGK